MRRREKIFWLIAGFVLILGVISLIPAHYEVCKEGAKASEESCPFYRLVPFLVIEVGKILDALSVAITALATIAIAWFTLSLRRSTDKLWDAGERQLALLAETSAAQSRDMQSSIAVAELSARAAIEEVKVSKETARPHLHLKTIHFLQGTGQDGAIEIVAFIPEIENTGTVPAQNCECWRAFRLLPPEDIESVVFDKGEGGQKSVVTSIGGGQGFRTTPAAFKIDDAVLIYQKTRACLIWTRVEFDDPFASGRRYAEYCFRADIIGDPRIVYPNGAPANIAAYTITGLQNTGGHV